ncbi:MAG: TonB-dependent receptor plug domain-containing protein [Bacteroidetes bacterium]|nr:TonB-dependent receptor plug domain-containing protein [Bacteroidota bacterium]
MRKIKDSTLIGANQSIGIEELNKYQPTDIGDALLKFNSISLKNYGGIGGLKSFSFRGIGSSHTVVVSDGFLLVNPQTGQVNLGNQMIHSVKKITLGRLSGEGMFPASAYVFSSALALETNDVNRPDSSLHLHTNLSFGSFGLKDGYMDVSRQKKKIGFNIYGRGRTFTGNYPFQINYGTYSLSDSRNNNLVRDLQWGGSLCFQPKENLILRVIGDYSSTNQGLPGAVVLYNPTVGQYLNQNQQRLGFDLKSKFNAFNFRVFTVFQRNYLQYQDSTFLNQQNYLESRYQSFQNNSGISTFWAFKKTRFFFNNDTEISQLNVFDAAENVKGRFVYSSVFGLEKSLKRGQMQLQGGYQRVLQTAMIFKNKDLFSGSGSLSRYLNKKQSIQWFLFSSYTNRLPSFSELYFGTIDNENLKVERAFQSQMGLNFDFSTKKSTTELRGLAYYNRVWDKIVAIPTKNLFVWSIQNVGIVDVFGSDLNISHHRRLDEKGKWNLSAVFKSSYQLALDKTSKDSPTYGHQIAYIPFQTIQTNLGIERKSTKFFIELFWSDFRYSLNQNIHANVLPSFYFIDLGLLHKFKIGKRNFLTIQFNVKNCTNQNFVFVRSFPMPQRNYLITLRYAF